MLTDFLKLSKVGAIKAAQTSGLPPFMKMGIAGGLAMLSDGDYARYAALVTEAIAALGETERGRAVLATLGIE